MRVLYECGEQEEKVENIRKYEILKRFIRQRANERVLAVSDMNGHIRLLGKRINTNEAMLREKCEEVRLKISNKTVAEGNMV